MSIVAHGLTRRSTGGGTRVVEMGQAVIRDEPTAAVVASNAITAVLVDAADAALSDDSFRIEVE